MSDWTREPWPDVSSMDFTAFLGFRRWLSSKSYGAKDEVVIQLSDYDRARAAVNALAGRVPEKLAALEAAVEDFLSAEQIRLGTKYVWPVFANALAAFRGETHE